MIRLLLTTEFNELSGRGEFQRSKRYSFMKRVTVAISLLACMVAITASAQTKHTLILEITAKSGETSTTSEAFLTYYLQGPEEGGIKVRQTGGETLMSWKRITRIDVTDATNPQDIKADIT